MGTVGLSFGSATSGTGFDVTSTVSSILAIESGVETPWKAQLASLQAKDTAFTAIGTQLSTLSTSLASLTSFDGLFASKQGSSSNTNVLDLTAASTAAVAGSHTVLVSSLAQTSSDYSDQITNSSDTLSGSLTVQVGSSGTSQTITIDSTTNTLATLAAAINVGSYGVTASVISSTTGSRLSLVSQTSGLAGELTTTSNLTDTTTSTAIGFQESQAGADANLTVDGLATTSASNTVSNAIPGVTFQLLATSTANAPVQVQITNDNTSIETAAQTFVTSYNAVLASITAQEADDSTGAAEPLFGDPTLSLLQTQLSTALTTGYASSSALDLSKLGITVGADGTLSLDVSTLDSALNSNFTGVETFFQATGSFGENLTTTLNQIGSSSPTGAVSLALAQDSTTESGLNTDISTEDAAIAAEKTNLTTELNLANEELQAIPEQLSEINELYSAQTGYNENVS